VLECRKQRISADKGRFNLAIQHQGVIARFFDLLDGVAEGDPLDILSDDFQFEMVFPGLGGPPDERISGSKEDFRQFMHKLHTRPEGPPARASGSERRHNIETLKVVDGVEFMLGKALGGRRSGTILAAAQADAAGKMTRYVVVMSSVKFTGGEDRTSPA